MQPMAEASYWPSLPAMGTQLWLLGRKAGAFPFDSRVNCPFQKDHECRGCVYPPKPSPAIRVDATCKIHRSGESVRGSRQKGPHDQLGSA